MGTAGHIDHGKTSLVKALTGYDADRLREEKERGITIALGFVSYTTAAGDEISIVDVPGHEKFIRTMISGAQGLDMITLVIAADDGVMPQTREHLDICSLLGIKHGLVALTKCDLVDDDWLELVKADIAKFTAGTFLQSAPVVSVSSATGDGLDDLKAAIESCAADVVEREVSGLTRMPIDRVFTMKGFGTVLTGTLISGELNVGDELTLLPSGKDAKVRGLQQHGKLTDSVLAGNRVAVNFTSLAKDESLRGELLVKSDSFITSPIYDVLISNVSAEKLPIKNLAKIRFLAHTDRCIAEIRLLSGKQIKPGESGYAQIKLDKPLPLTVDDRFILLGTSKVQTLGGGTILNIPEKLCRKKMQGELEAALKTIKDSDSIARAEIFITRSGLQGMSLKRLSTMLNLKEKVIAKGLAKSLATGALIKYDSDRISFVSAESFCAVKDKILNILDEFHKEHPATSGMVREELKGKIAQSMPERLYLHALKSLEKGEDVVVRAELVMLAAHAESGAQFSGQIREEIESVYQESYLTPPSLSELKKQLSTHKPNHIDDTFNTLVREGVLVRISEGYYLHAESFSRLTAELTAYLAEHGSIDAAGFKTITNTSRKYSIPLLEKFDMIGVTIRRADNTRVPGSL